MLYAQYTMLHVPGSIHYALCSMLYALCPMFHAQVLQLQSELRTADAVRLGRTQKLTSHSIRRVVATMARHQGLSSANIIRWVYWKDQSMPYTYVRRQRLCAFS